MSKRSVAVCGVRFAIVEGPLDNHGEFSSSESVIRIRVTDSADQKRDTLIHEVLHGIWAYSGLAETIKGHLAPGTDSDALEETCVRILTPHVLRAIDSCDL